MDILILMDLREILRDVNMKVRSKKRIIKWIDVFGVIVLLAFSILLFNRYKSRCLLG
jgi:hypothetical protein